MQMGFVSAILPDLSLEEVLEFAEEQGFDCVELMCWPKGKAERRYAGVTHVDVSEMTSSQAEEINGLFEERGVFASGLGYYPNPLSPDTGESEVAVAHIRKVITAAKLLGIGVVNTFIGRDWTRSVEDNWPRFMKIWPDLIKFAEDHDVRVAIENCPMFFSADEWPGGKNLAHTPAFWRRMFEAVPSDHFGLNFDPSHLVWQSIDCDRALREFKDKIFHVHAKDARVDTHRLAEVGILAHPLEFHTPKLPGMGDVNWRRFFSVLTDTGYDGPVCIEVEDRAYEGSLEKRMESLVQSSNYLTQFIA